MLEGCVRGKLNILISGGTGVGKTTLLNVLSSFIPDTERIITIEDAAELQLHQQHVVSLESRPANIEGQGEIRIRDLVRNALRMRPDRIIVGEVRGAETVDMLQAMNTGHEGSMTTIHANSPRDALARLEVLVLTAGVDLPLRAIREQIASAFDVVVQISRLVDGSRVVTHVTEVLRMESDVITIQDLFLAKPGSGAARPTGIRPHFADKLAASGVTLPAERFDPVPRLAAAGGRRVMTAALAGILFAGVVAALDLLRGAARPRDPPAREVRRQLGPYLAEAELARAHNRRASSSWSVSALGVEPLLARLGSHERCSCTSTGRASTRAPAPSCASTRWPASGRSCSCSRCAAGAGGAGRSPRSPLRGRPARARAPAVARVRAAAAGDPRHPRGLAPRGARVRPCPPDRRDRRRRAGRARVPAGRRRGASGPVARGRAGRARPPDRSADLQFVLDAITIQRQVGGSLAELFELVAETVRAREQFRRKLQAITGLVRISANMLTALPIVAAIC